MFSCVYDVWRHKIVHNSAVLLKYPMLSTACSKILETEFSMADKVTFPTIGPVSSEVNLKKFGNLYPDCKQYKKQKQTKTKTKPKKIK